MEKQKPPLNFFKDGFVWYRRDGRMMIRPFISMIFSMLYQKQTGTATE